ncbi:MAG TPA: APC family permease [Kofleriaceae bacterium]
MEELKRAIGGRMLIVFIIGDILGAGIYLLVRNLAKEVGGVVWLPLAIGFAVSALTAASYAELVGKYPRAAGAALYTHRAFGKPFITFIVAFAVMMSGIASASAAAVAFGSTYLQAFADIPWLPAAFFFLAAITAVNFIGISHSVKVNLVLTVIEVSGLVIVLVVGAIGLFRGQGDPSRAFVLDAPNGAVLGLIGATAIGFYALIGFEDSVNLAEETQQPHRTFPRALFAGITITGLIYVLVSFVAVAVVPPAQLAASSEGPLLLVVKAGGVAFPPELFAGIALLAICNTALINMIMASRLLYGMANENIVPRGLARVHSKRKTPYVAILFTTTISAALIMSGAFRDLKATRESFADLANTTVLLLLLVFAMVNVCVLVLRKKPVDHPHFKTPVWAAVFGAISTLILASPITGRSPRVYAIAGILVGIGGLLWFINRLITGKRITEIDAEKLIK